VRADLGQARRSGKIEEELERLRRIPLLIVDEVGYIPFDPEAASLYFSLMSSRYEQASLIVSSNQTFSAWAEIFGDAVPGGPAGPPRGSHRPPRRQLPPQRPSQGGPTPRQPLTNRAVFNRPKPRSFQPAWFSWGFCG
jgi:IstB-like ATP binding protein